MTAAVRLLRSRIAASALRPRIVAHAIAPRTLSTVVRPRVAITPLMTSAVRRYSAAAAQEVEAEGEAEQQWPEPVLPKLSETDAKRLTRQRNIGM